MAISRRVFVEGSIVLGATALMGCGATSNGDASQDDQDTANYTIDDVIQAYADGDGDKADTIRQALGITDRTDRSDCELLGKSRRVASADSPEDQDCVDITTLATSVSKVDQSQSESDSANALKDGMDTIVTSAQIIVHHHGECLAPLYEAFKRWPNNLGTSDNYASEFCNDPYDDDVAKLEKELVQADIYCFNARIMHKTGDPDSQHTLILQVHNGSSQAILAIELWASFFDADGNPVPVTSDLTDENGPDNWAVVVNQNQNGLNIAAGDDQEFEAPFTKEDAGAIVAYAAPCVYRCGLADGIIYENNARIDWQNYYGQYGQKALDKESLPELPCTRLKDSWDL